MPFKDLGNISRICGCKKISKSYHNPDNYFFLNINNFHFSIEEIPQNAFRDLHSLEWLKLYSNQLRTLHYEVMEPILDTLKHIDIHSKIAKNTMIY